MSKRKKKRGKKKRNPRRVEKLKQKRLAKSPRDMFRKTMTRPGQVFEPKRGGKYNRRQWRQGALREMSDNQYFISTKTFPSFLEPICVGSEKEGAKLLPWFVFVSVDNVWKSMG